MFRGLHRLLVAAADWHPRDFLIGAIGAEVVTLVAMVSLGFGTFAAYMHLSAAEGPVFAAVAISAAYGVVAVIAGAGLARWYATSSRDPATVPPASVNPETLLRSLAESGSPQDQAALTAALRLGRALSPMELLALSLVGGFLAGRRAGK